MPSSRCCSPTWASDGAGVANVDPIIRVSGLRTQFGRQVVHDNLDLEVMPGEVLGVVGGSGTGKSVLLRTIVGLNRQTAGSIAVFGQDTAGLNGAPRAAPEA